MHYININASHKYYATFSKLGNNAVDLFGYDPNKIGSCFKRVE
jgi:hypothetical protein